MSPTQLGLWPARLAWFLLPIVTGFGFGDLLAERSNAVATTAETGLWLGWFVGLVALLAPSTVSLTIVRILAPGAVLAVIVAIVADGFEFAPAVIAALGAAIIVAVIISSAWTGDQMVNGSAYGPERRMALRPPAALLLGPLQIVWLLVAAGLIAGPLFVAAGNLVVGIPLTIVGLAVAFFGTKSLHQLSKRWIVFVPAGFVLHDYFVLAESLLMTRKALSTLGPLPLDKGELLDLTAGSPGLALLAELKEQTPLAVRAGRGNVQTVSAQRVVFTPSLPGALIKEARIRGIKISS